MSRKQGGKLKIIITFTILFVTVFLLMLLIFFAGKKSYTVTFDLNGGILLSGDTEQRVMQGQNAYPPETAKDGHYLRGWSTSYTKVTRDTVVKAIWEYETTPGIIYSDSDTVSMNYCEIVGSYKGLRGEVYIGAYHDEKMVLGITEGAFKDRDGITAVYLLDGILSIGDEAFAGCDNLETIDIPSTVVTIGKDAFKDCKNLKSITLPEGLETIEEGAFSGCESLEEIIVPWTVTDMGVGVFDTEGLTVYLHTQKPDYEKEDEEDEKKHKKEDEDDTEEELPEEEPVRNFADGWHTDVVTVKFIKVIKGEIIEAEATPESPDGSGSEDDTPGDEFA